MRPMLLSRGAAARQPVAPGTKLSLRPVPRTMATISWSLSMPMALNMIATGMSSPTSQRTTGKAGGTASNKPTSHHRSKQPTARHARPHRSSYAVPGNPGDPTGRSTGTRHATGGGGSRTRNGTRGWVQPQQAPPSARTRAVPEEVLPRLGKQGRLGLLLVGGGGHRAQGSASCDTATTHKSRAHRPRRAAPNPTVTQRTATTVLTNTHVPAGCACTSKHRGYVRA
jgi:hypothetical protein